MSASVVVAIIASIVAFGWLFWLLASNVVESVRRRRRDHEREEWCKAEELKEKMSRTYDTCALCGKHDPENPFPYATLDCHREDCGLP